MKKFKIEIKYTGLLKLKDVNLNKTINSGRLQSIKKALKKVIHQKLKEILKY